uniref:Uncharacterized protein n=1 Tax=Arundo donax TaxID=35708 RepID=A0A0A9CF08_ARUDO
MSMMVCYGCGFEMARSWGMALCHFGPHPSCSQSLQQRAHTYVPHTQAIAAEG